MEKGTNYFNLLSELQRIKIAIPLIQLFKITSFNKDLKKVFGISSLVLCDDSIQPFYISFLLHD